MSQNRSVAVVLTLAVVLQATAAVAGVAAAQETHVAISGVDVSPNDPAPGEEFTVTANLSNLASSNGTVTVTDVYVRDGAEEFARVSDPGSITSGNTMSVPLASVDEVPTSGPSKIDCTAVDDEVGAE